MVVFLNGVVVAIQLEQHNIIIVSLINAPLRTDHKKIDLTTQFTTWQTLGQFSDTT